MNLLVERGVIIPLSTKHRLTGAVDAFLRDLTLDAKVLSLRRYNFQRIRLRPCREAVTVSKVPDIRGSP